MTGKQLLEKARGNGMRVEELAVCLGVSVNTLWRWGKEERRLGKRTLLALQLLNFMEPDSTVERQKLAKGC